MKVGVLGINHKLANLHLREILAKTCQRRFSAESSTHGHHACVLLSTCNRTEVYFSSEDLAETHSYLLAILRQEVDEEFDQKLYSYFSFDCFFHLARVTAGLDSAIVAETEIQGQVKESYERAAHFSSLTKDLHYLFQKALKIGKDVRSKLFLKPGLPNLEHAILNTGTHFFKNLEKPRILFIGASDINCKVISFLNSRHPQQITLCNRSPQKAQDIAGKFQLDLLDWHHIENWINFDWIVVGTKSSEYLIHDQPFTASQKLIIDLSVPRNVDPSIGKLTGITLLNMDQITRLLKIRTRRIYDTVIQAERMTLDAAQCQHSLFREKESRRLQLLAVS
jgi:glutamyl-tRNA reductase